MSNTSVAQNAGVVGTDITSDVDVIMRDYFTTLSAKDEDIFRLYEDNKRIRAVAEDSQKHRADLETRLSSLSLLVETLRTEISEKQHLIDAQEAESRVLREGAAALRAAIGQPSVALTITLEDVVEEVQRVVSDRFALEEALDSLDHGARTLASACTRLLLDEERRGRRRLEEAALFPFTTPLLGDLQKDLVYFITRTERELAEARRSAAEEVAGLQEARQYETHHASLQLARALRSAEEAHEKRVAQASAADRREVTEEERHCRQCSALADLHEPLLGQLHERCVAAERQWYVLSSKLSSSTEACEKLSTRLALTEDELLTAKASLAQSQETVGNLRRQREKDEILRRELEACQGRLDYRGKELDELKDKNVSLCQKLITQRQHYSNAIKEAKENADKLQTQVADLQRRNMHLEEHTTSLQRDVKTKSKRVHVLERKLEEAVATKTAADDAHEHERTEAKEQHLNEVRGAVKAAELRAQVALAEQKKQLQEQQEASEEILQNEHQRALAQLTEKYDQEIAEQARKFQLERSALRHEIEEWVALVDQLRDELRAAQSQAAAEKTARLVLSQQHQAESILLDRVKQRLDASKKNDEEERGDDVSCAEREGTAEQQQHAVAHSLHSFLDKTALHSAQQADTASARECEALKRQVRVLEEACRRSAAVITELREGQIRTSRADSGFSFLPGRGQPPHAGPAGEGPTAANSSFLSYQGSWQGTQTSQSPPQRSTRNSQLHPTSSQRAAQQPRQQEHQSMLSALIADMDRDY